MRGVDDRHSLIDGDITVVTDGITGLAVTTENGRGVGYLLDDD